MFHNCSIFVLISLTSGLCFLAGVVEAPVEADRMERWSLWISKEAYSGSVGAAHEFTQITTSDTM